MEPINLTDETIAKIVNGLIGGDKKIKKLTSQKKLRNVKELLSKYPLLENHLDVDLPKIESETPLSKNQLSLYSLLGYRARSKELMEFVNIILKRYKDICYQGDDKQRRKYDIIYNLYLSDNRMTYIQLANKHNLDPSTVHKYEKSAINDIAVMIFGADSLNDISIRP